MQIQKISKSWYGGIISSGVLLVLIVVAMLCPIVPEGASAATGESSIGGEGQNTSSTTTEPSISMALSSRTELDITPTTSGTFEASTAKLQVAVNTPTGYTADGYKIYMSATDGNTLKGTGDNSATINPVPESILGVNFPNNTWGYALWRTENTATTDSARYRPVPTSNTVVYSSTDLAGTYNLAFATKVDMSIPADQYSGSVVVSVVAEPRLVTTLSAITNMQDMTTQICTDSAENETKQLVDTRDNQKYWVTKLKDGNCWMTQNLALDITEAGLSATDTDITRDWTATQSADPSVTTVYAPIDIYTSVSSGSTSATATGSWNLSGVGENRWVLGAPLKGTLCGDGSVVTDINTCTKVGFVKIDDSWSPTFEAKSGVFNAPNTDYTNQTTYITLDYSKKEYDPHYLVGNYYQWNTATAGTGGAVTNTDAISSICPKEWQLPGAGTSTHPTFDNLLNIYGLNGRLSTTGNNSMPDVENGLYNIAAAPLYFVRGGSVWVQSKRLDYAGMSGSYYSSMPLSSLASYMFFGNTSSNFISLDNGQRNFGRSVRCVAR